MYTFFVKLCGRSHFFGTGADLHHVDKRGYLIRNVTLVSPVGDESMQFCHKLRKICMHVLA